MMFGKSLSLNPTLYSSPPPQTPSGKRKGQLPNDAFCHVCIAECGLYAWLDQKRDKSSIPQGYPFSDMPFGCGGCGGCDRCLPALACDGSRVVQVKLGRHLKVYPVHLPCFVRRCLIVDLAPSGQGSCHIDEKPIEKGEPRLVVVVPKHNGEADSKVLLRMRSAKSFLDTLRREPALSGFDASSLQGMAQLPPAARQWSLGVLNGDGGALGSFPAHSGAVPKYAFKDSFPENYKMECKDCKRKRGS